MLGICTVANKGVQSIAIHSCASDLIIRINNNSDVWYGFIHEPLILSSELTTIAMMYGNVLFMCL